MVLIVELQSVSTTCFICGHSAVGRLALCHRIADYGADQQDVMRLMRNGEEN